MARLAIVITCYNESRYIRQAVTAALNQTVKGSQIIVVDDGSEDGSDAEIADLDVEVIRITNRGQPAAKNAALLSLDDDIEWVIFTDGDDQIAENYVETMLRYVDGPADIVFPCLLKEGEAYPAKVKLYHPTVEQLWEEFPGYSSFMASRKLLKAMGGFHPATSGHQDWDFVLDARIRGAQFAYNEDTWFWYRHNLQGWTLQAGDTSQILDEMRRHHGV